MPTALRVKGNQITGLVRQTGDTCVQLDDGSWEATVKYIARWTQVMYLAPQRNVARHPDFPSLQCTGCSINRLKPGLVAELTAKYRGFFGSEDPPLDTSTEEVITSTSEAPIETHPDFVDVLGGNKDNPLNGAIFDGDGQFTGWAADSPYAGKESYLIPSTIYRRSSPRRESPNDIGDVGTISSPGVGGGPSGSNWMFTARTWRRDGAVYTVTEEWMLSGPGGFDPTIYSES